MCPPKNMTDCDNAVHLTQPDSPAVLAGAGADAGELVVCAKEIR